MPSLISHSSLHSIKRASCPCPGLRFNMVNMRVGVMWYRASHARRLWQTEHTAGGTQEGKNKRPVAAGGSKQRMHSSEAGWRRLMLEIQALRDASAVRHSTQ